MDVLTLSGVEAVLVLPHVEWLGDRAGDVDVLILSCVEVQLGDWISSP